MLPLSTNSSNVDSHISAVADAVGTLQAQKFRAGTLRIEFNALNRDVQHRMQTPNITEESMKLGQKLLESLNLSKHSLDSIEDRTNHSINEARKKKAELEEIKSMLNSCFYLPKRSSLISKADKIKYEVLNDPNLILNFNSSCVEQIRLGVLPVLDMLSARFIGIRNDLSKL